MPDKTECQLAFELETITWRLEYDRRESGSYDDYETGIMFGAFSLGWDAALRNKAKNA